MRIPRIYHPTTLHPHSQIVLSDMAAHHIRVLRLQAGDPLRLFDGSNQFFHAQITHINKKVVQVKIGIAENDNRESPLYLHLGQVISRGEKMEFTIQKGVELGVNTITPLLSSRCGVNLPAERLSKKLLQWQQIAIAACEQSGRNELPSIRPVMSLLDWCQETESAVKIHLHPQATQRLSTLTTPVQRIRLLIGPEGGLSTEEIDMTAHYGFNPISLGPRVLRTETAALAAITALQVCFGDLG